MRLLHDKHLLLAARYAVSCGKFKLEDGERKRKTARNFHRAMQLIASGQATGEEVGYREEPCPRASFDLDLVREEYAAARAM